MYNVFPKKIKKYPFCKRALLCTGDNNPFPSYLLLLMPHFFPPIFWQGNIISSTQENRHFDAFGWWGGNREQGCHQKLLDSPPRTLFAGARLAMRPIVHSEGCGKTLVSATNIYPCSCCCCSSPSPPPPPHPSPSSPCSCILLLSLPNNCKVLPPPFPHPPSPIFFLGLVV